jgi:hypothetical protein
MGCRWGVVEVGSGSMGSDSRLAGFDSGAGCWAGLERAAAGCGRGLLAVARVVWSRRAGTPPECANPRQQNWYNQPRRCDAQCNAMWYEAVVEKTGRIDVRRVQTWMAFICLHLGDSRQDENGCVGDVAPRPPNPSSCRHSQHSHPPTFYNSPALGWWRCTQNAPDSDHPPSSASRGRAARR